MYRFLRNKMKRLTKTHKMKKHIKGGCHVVMLGGVTPAMAQFNLKKAVGEP